MNLKQGQGEEKKDQEDHKGKVPGIARLEADQSQITAEKKRCENYNNAIRLSEQLRIEITKGVQSGGVPLQDLFLKACKIISLITGDRCFYTQIAKIIKE